MGDLIHFPDRDPELPADRPRLTLRQTQGGWLIVALPISGPEKPIAHFLSWSPAAVAIDAMSRAWGWPWQAEEGPPDG